MVAGETLLNMSGSEITALRLLPDVESVINARKTKSSGRVAQLVRALG